MSAPQSHIRPRRVCQWQSVTALLAALLVSPAAGAAQDNARFIEGEYAHYRVLEQVLNRTGDRSSLFGRDGPCRYVHTYGKTLAPGTWIDRETRFDARTLDVAQHRVEDREGGAVQMLILPLRAEAEALTHSLALTNRDGTLQGPFQARYGGTCDDMYCDATVQNRSVSIAVVGPTAATDITQVSTAVIGLAEICAQAAPKGG